MEQRICVVAIFGTRARPAAMPSPFPGMNPFIEQAAVWEDFHHSLMTEIRKSLISQVRPNFLVKLEQYVFIREPDSEERGKRIGKPDVSIFASGQEAPAALTVQATSTIEPLIARIPQIEVEKHTYIEIRDRQNHDLVTMLEVLSPSNKRYGPDREQYLMKRSVLMVSPVSIVEIDLLRDGPRMPIEDAPECDYLAMVSRPAMRPNVELWPIQLEQPLPIIPIPLRGEFPDARLDLQAMLHYVYDSAGYEDYIYDSPPSRD